MAAAGPGRFAESFTDGAARPLRKIRARSVSNRAQQRASCPVANAPGSDRAARRHTSLHCTLAALVLAGCSGRPAPQTVWIGHVAPLSGPARQMGLHARQGVQVAVTEVRSEGLLEWPFAVVHADTRGEADLVQAETARLLSVNKVVALLAGPQAGEVQRIVRAAEPSGTGVVVPCELPEGVGGPGVLSLAAAPEDRGRALAQYAAGSLKARQATVFIDGRDPIAPAVAAAIVKEWRHDGRSVLERTYTSTAQRDELVARAEGTKADLIVLACPTGDFDWWRDRLAAGGVHGPVIYAGPDVGATVTQPSGEGASEVYLATAFSNEKLTDAGQAFARRYETDFHEPPDLFAAAAYDGTRLFVELLRRAHSASAGSIRQEMERLERFDAVTGSIRWDKGRTRRALFIVRIKGGTGRVVRTFEPPT